MTIGVYLHSYIADTLRCYGNLSDVVDRILAEGANGAFELTDLQKCESRDNVSRYNIEVTNPDYLQLVYIYGVNSSKISLRRILYWFVENEMYEQLGWTPIRAYISKNDKLILTRLSNVLKELNKALLYASANVKPQLTAIYNDAQSLYKKLTDR